MNVTVFELIRNLVAWM